MNKHIILAGAAAAALGACSQDRGITTPRDAAAARLAASAPNASPSPSAAYTLTNQVTGNAVLTFRRAADGTLTAAAQVATGGSGTGNGLGSQGALALSDDGRWLFAVNAGSNEVSTFRVTPAGLALAQRVPSGGTQPISLTVHGALLYVLNAGGSGNITGFTVGTDGTLTAVAGSTRPLSGPAVGPAEVAFSPDGGALVVTEKNTNALDVYAVGPDGIAGGPASRTSAGVQPFGFAFGLRGEMFVSEATSGSASSYALGADGRLTLVSGAVATHQGAPCWLVVTQDGRFAYTANARSGTISGFAVGSDGSLRLIDANGITARVRPGNIDLALSEDSRYLYQLNGAGSITAFRVQSDGHLTAVGGVTGLPAGVVGLAAR
jgi:6-phosphogluconolactonase